MNDLVPYISAVVSKICGDGQSLTQGSSYPVIQMSDTDYRVIDDLGEPSLYPRSYFLEDRLEPPLEWITKNFEEGEYWAIPNELSARRLFEDFFDGNEESIATIKAFAERAARQSDGQ